MKLARKTDAERAEQEQLREQKRLEQAERDRIANIEKRKRAFEATPPGRARSAFDRGDHVFQYSLDVMNQAAIIVAMVGSSTSRKTTDPVEILNAVCREGWELVNGSFVFVEQGQQSRDKFMSSGQNVAIKGATVGYYLFRRCEEHRVPPADVWVLEESSASNDEMSAPPVER